MAFSEHHYCSRDGLRLYYRMYGTGDDIAVCLPGLTRNCKDFEGLAEHLSEKWRVISPDLRGRGQSERDSKPRHYHPGTYVGDLWTLLDEINVGRLVVIGTSLGGLMAMIMADQQPQRLRGVVLNDIGPELPLKAVARILQYAGRTPAVENWGLAAKQAQRAYGQAYPNEPAEFWLRMARLSYRQNATGMVEPDMDPAIGGALRNSNGLMPVLRWLHKCGWKHRMGGMNIDPWDSFRAITMPCLLVHGALSDVLTTDIVERMRAAKPDLQLVTVPDRGHAPLLDEPSVRAAIDQFLGRLLEPGGRS